jgi:ketosteroid isomerase-like protein
MAATSIDNELVQLETRYWTAMKDKDVDAAVGMTDEPCIVTGGQGVGRVSREEFRKLMTNATWTLHEFTMENMQTRMISDDVAVVAYKVTEKLTVEGKPLTLVASDSSTWVRRNGTWKCAAHTEAVAGDPFGRDRKPMAAGTKH